MEIEIKQLDFDDEDKFFGPLNSSEIDILQLELLLIQ